MSTPGARGPLVSATVNTISIVLLLSLSLITFGYQRALLPLYGSAATEHHLNKIVWLVCIVGTFMPALPAWPSVLLGGVLLCSMPQTAYWVAVYTGQMGDVIWGPVITHLSVLAPVLLLGVAVVKVLQTENDTAAMMGAPVQAITLPVCRMAIMTLQELWPLVPFIEETSETDIFTYIGCGTIALWALSPLIPSFPQAVPTPSNPTAQPKRRPQSSTSKDYWRLAVLPLIPYLLNNIQSPTLPKPLLEPFIHPTAPMQILSSVRSPYSGVILVGEVLPPTPEELEVGDIIEPRSLRYLRAGHSLLGGVWIGDRVYRKDGLGPLAFDQDLTPLGDSIYSAFVTQEAVRLVTMEEGSAQQNALIIGLGTGISASALIQHNISTTIVEIDPAVYEAATRYFGLVVPEPEKVFLTDARGWVISQTHAEMQGVSDITQDTPSFDIVIHDCFSGGGVPSHLFTQPFWEDLRKLVKPDGVVAVNFAGKLASDSSRAVILTLKQVFPQCRAFHDSLKELSEEELKTEFVNWVFFCTPSAKPLTFRAATESDYLNSYLRERVLSTLPEHEINLNLVIGDPNENDHRKYVLTDERNPLGNWQAQEALHHWKLMREVLPDVYWETY